LRFRVTRGPLCGFELSVKGSPAKTYGPGEGFQIPPNSRNDDKAAKLTITYVVDKDKPLALPAQE
jgi:hypothetical protein